MTTLFQTLASGENLNEAFKQTRDKAYDMTKREYELALQTNIDRLSTNLERGVYEHGPVERRYVDKADGTRRPIGLMELEDKIVQTAALRVLTPRLGAEFAEVSFGRQGLGRVAATDYIYISLFDSGFRHWAMMDVEDCYGSLGHGNLLDFLDVSVDDPKTVELVQQMLFVNVIDGSEVLPPADRGIEQGMPISQLLANLYLHYVLESDEALNSLDIVYARYVDDIIIGAPSGQAVDDAIATVEAALGWGGLKLKPAKTQRHHLSKAGDGFTYLGTRFEQVDLPAGPAWRRSIA